MCRDGQAVVRDIFADPAAGDLRGLIVWLPMLPGDSAESAVRQSEVFQDARVVQGWDPHRQIGDIFAGTLKLTRTAWDVYLLYPPGAEWRGDAPPPPAFWMHQLTPDWGADQQLRLDPDTLSREVLKSLGQSQ